MGKSDKFWFKFYLIYILVGFIVLIYVVPVTLIGIAGVVLYGGSVLIAAIGAIELKLKEFDKWINEV